MKVKDVMNTGVVSIFEKATVREAAQKMLEFEIHALPVIDRERRVVGLITEDNIFVRYRGFPFTRTKVPTVINQLVSSASEVAGIYEEIDAGHVDDIMHSEIILFDEEDDLWQAILRMAKEDLKYVPVVRDKKLSGILTRADIIRLMASPGV